MGLEAAPEEFNLAVSEFLDFLRRESVANQVEWVFPEDLQLVEGRFYVRICWIGDCAYSNVYVPDNDREAELHLMPTGLPTRLKLSYPSQGGWDGERPSRDEHRDAVPVSTKVRWLLLKRKGAKNETIKLQLLR